MRERVGQTDATAGLCRASKARFWSLVDFIFLRQTEPAWPAKWIRPPKVSVLTGADFVCVCARTLEFETKPPFPSSALQERNLHSGRRPGDLHRQGDGSEAATQRNQRQREARSTATCPPDTLVLDLMPPWGSSPPPLHLSSVTVGDDKGACYL